MAQAGFSLDKRRFRGGLTSLYNSLIEGSVQVRVSLFSQATRDSPVDIVLSCARGGFVWTSGGVSSQKEVIRHWNGLPREVVESPSLEVFKERLDVALSATV